MAKTAEKIVRYASCVGAIAMLSIGFSQAPSAYGTESSSTSACSLYASLSGSDSAPGTLSRPFATVQHLVDELAPGQTGCVRGGDYVEDVTVSHGGSATAPLTLTSYPDERATVTGRFWIAEGADHVTVTELNLDGKNEARLPSPTVNSEYASFISDDVTNENTEICFVIGSKWGRAWHTLIEGDRIHNCGVLPSVNQDHGIYVDEATATTIRGNVIYDNVDRGIQLYPDAQGTVIEHNIISGNGEGIIFSGAEGTASSNTRVRENLITDAATRYDVESWYPSGNPLGIGNVVEDNCVWGGAEGNIASEEGFSAAGNVTANPEYRDPSAGDYSVSSTSPCAAFVASSQVPAMPFPTSGQDTYTPTSTSSTTTTTTTSSSSSTTSTETSTGEATTSEITTSEVTTSETIQETTSTSSSTHTRTRPVSGKGHKLIARAALVRSPIRLRRRMRHHRHRHDHGRWGTRRHHRGHSYRGARGATVASMAGDVRALLQI